jgi:hypothetical protein
MEFIPVWSYENYIPAHIAMGFLKEQGIECWLKDENTLTLDPMLSIALGGIRLMVPKREASKALGLLKQLETEHKSKTPCPRCNSINTELIGSLRKRSNWLMAVLSIFTATYPVYRELVHHCFDCGYEFPFE